MQQPARILRPGGQASSPWLNASQCLARQVESCRIPAIRLLLVLTHLLTTVLDDHGRERTEERSEQDRSDPVDVTGRL
jgi:hypothetical protein